MIHCCNWFSQEASICDFACYCIILGLVAAVSSRLKAQRVVWMTLYDKKQPGYIWFRSPWKPIQMSWAYFGFCSDLNYVYFSVSLCNQKLFTQNRKFVAVVIYYITLYVWWTAESMLYGNSCSHSLMWNHVYWSTLHTQKAIISCIHILVCCMFMFCCLYVKTINKNLPEADLFSKQCPFG